MAFGAQRQVQFPGAQAVHQEVAGQAQDVHLHRGMALGEAAEHLGDVAQGVVVGRAETDGALDDRGAEAGPDVVVQGQHLARATEEELAVRGELDGAALAAGEQAVAEHGLEPLYLHADSRLGAADAQGGAGEAAFLGDEDERAEEVWVEAEGEGHEHQYR